LGSTAVVLDDHEFLVEGVWVCFDEWGGPRWKEWLDTTQLLVAVVDAAGVRVWFDVAEVVGLVDGDPLPELLTGPRQADLFRERVTDIRNLVERGPAVIDVLMERRRHWFVEMDGIGVAPEIPVLGTVPSWFVDLDARLDALGFHVGDETVGAAYRNVSGRVRRRGPFAVLMAEEWGRPVVGMSLWPCHGWVPLEAWWLWVIAQAEMPRETPGLAEAGEILAGFYRDGVSLADQADVVLGALDLIEQRGCDREDWARPAAAAIQVRRGYARRREAAGQSEPIGPDGLTEELLWFTVAQPHERSPVVQGGDPAKGLSSFLCEWVWLVR
jgi:hypothetical protein